MQPLEESPWNRDQPYHATLKTQRSLTGQGSEKDVRHIEIDLGDSGIRYEPGDTLGVWIRNDPELVDELLGCLGLAATEPVDVEGKVAPLRDALAADMEITQVHPGFLKRYAEASGNAALNELCANPKTLRTYLDRRQIIDVLRQYPGNIDAQAFISCLRRLTPRQYSIASSQHQRPHSIELCVGQVLYEQDDALRKGAGSVYLGYRVHVGDSLPVFVVPNPNFRLPADPDAPVIMIGPGTGIAPFRAFLQERESTGARGHNWLLSGNPHRTTDYMYGEELEAWRANGLLTRLDLAFSRDQAEKRYVQHCLLDQSAEVFAWLEQGASLYVCGDARRMAEDVQQALLRIIATESGLDDAGARQYLVRLRQQKRYQRDVY